MKHVTVIVGSIAAILIIGYGVILGLRSWHRTTAVAPQNSTVQVNEHKSREIDLYFSNWNAYPEASCDVVFPVKRGVDENLPTPETARRAIEQLIAGPTVAEKSEGYTGAFLEGTQLKSVAVDSGTAYIDFEALPIAGSCAVGAARAQIEQTLLQFSEVERVMIMLNGSTDEALQP